MPGDLHEDPPAVTSRNRPRTWLLVGAVAVVATTASLGLIAATGALSVTETPSTPETRAPSAAPDNAATPPPIQPTSGASPGELTPTKATGVLTSLLDRLAETAADPGAGIDGLGELATGAIVEELENEQQELADNGWTRSGRESIVSVEVTAEDPGASPPTATVEACVDSKDVVLLDSAGKPIVSGMTPQQKRSINIYTLVLDGSSWRVADRSFPDNAGC